MSLYRLRADLRVREASMVVFSEFEVITPGSLTEALDALASGRNIRPIAGGTDVMVLLESGNLSPCTFLNLEYVPELRSPVFNGDGAVTVMPALTTYRDVRVGA